MSIPGKLESLRRLGPRRAAIKAAFSVANRVGDFRMLVGLVAERRDLDEHLLELPAGLTGRFVRADALKPFVGREYKLDEAFVAEAAAKGDQCFAVYDGERLAAYGWYSTRPTSMGDGLTVHFDPAYIYRYKGFTHPDYRGRRLHGMSLSIGLEAYTRLGYAGLLSYVETNNRVSMRSLERAGYRPFGKIWIMGRSGVYHTHMDAGCLAYGFRVSPPDVPAADATAARA